MPDLAGKCYTALLNATAADWQTLQPQSAASTPLRPTCNVAWHAVVRKRSVASSRAADAGKLLLLAACSRALAAMAASILPYIHTIDKFAEGRGPLGSWWQAQQE